MRTDRHFILEDFFDDNSDINDIDNLTDDLTDNLSSTLSPNELKQQAEMSATLVSAHIKYYNILKKFLDKLNSMYDIFNLYYYEDNSSSYIINVDFFYTLKKNININLFYNYSKLLFSFVRKLEDTHLTFKTYEPKDFNFVIDDNMANAYPLEIYICGNFFINHLFDKYAETYTMERLSKVLKNYYKLHFNILDYTFNHNHAYAFLPIFPLTEKSDKDFACILSSINPYVYMVNENPDVRETFYRASGDFKLNTSYTYKKRDFQNALQSGSYEYLASESDDNAKNFLESKNADFKVLWHNTPFYVTKRQAQTTIPAIAIELKLIKV